MPIIGRFSEIVGICKSCLRNKKTAVTWIAPNNAAQNYISPLHNNPRLRKNTKNMLQSKINRALEQTKRFSNPQSIFDFLKKELFGRDN